MRCSRCGSARFVTLSVYAGSAPADLCVDCRKAAARLFLASCMEANGRTHSASVLRGTHCAGQCLSCARDVRSMEAA